LSHTREVGHYKIDFFFIGGKLRNIGMEVELILKQKIVELVGIRTVKGIQNAGL